MNLKATLACAAGVCLGIALFHGAAGNSGRLAATPPGGGSPAPERFAPSLPRPHKAPAGADHPDAGESGDLEPAPPSVHRSRIFDARDGVEVGRFGEPAVLLSDRPLQLPEAVLCVLVPGSGGFNALSPLRVAIRLERPRARIAIAGFQPGSGGDGPEAVESDAGLLASVDALALEPPAGTDAEAIEAFYEEAGRRGRRVLALLGVPRAAEDLPAWIAGFRGATGAGVGVVLTGGPGEDPAVGAVWRRDVEEHLKLQRRLAGIAYD